MSYLWTVSAGYEPERRFSILRLLCSAALIAALGHCAHFVYRTRPPQLLAGILRIERLPASARNISCESPAITDVVTICSFDVDPAEFPALLAGWPFEERRLWSGSALPGDLQLEWRPATEFRVEPAEFAHGGSVTLVADARRARVVVDYYEE